MRYDRPHLVRLLRQLGDAEASDLLLKVPGRPALRIDGEMVRLAEDPLRPVDTKNAAMSLMGLADVELTLVNLREQELAFGMPGVGRFRALIYRQRGSLGISIRRLAVRCPSLSELGTTPEQVKHLDGLSFVSGPRQQAMMAAIVDHWNQHVGGHLVVLEDQIEYLHRDARAAVSHREVGTDTQDWPSGLRSALRHDADFVVLGSVPDQASAERILQGAEHGRRILVCVPSHSAKGALSSFIRLFPAEREREVKSRVVRVLARSFHAPETGAVSVFDSEDLNQQRKAG
ncbi:MAG: twitching motility protein PilT [Cognaticolwellia sp.]